MISYANYTLESVVIRAIIHRFNNVDLVNHVFIIVSGCFFGFPIVSKRFIMVMCDIIVGQSKIDSILFTIECKVPCLVFS